MSTPPAGSDPLPDEGEPGDPGDADLSGEGASDPEAARREAEDALAEIEALADLDDDPDGDSGDARSEPPGTTRASAAPEDQCENCGALLHGPYCSECGQSAADRIVPVWHLINEALESLFQLDLRVFRTFPRFIFLPGRLTKEYLNGRRTRYIRPFRLYLFATFILFAVVAFTTTGGFGLVLDPQGAVRLNPPNTEVTAGRVTDTTATSSESSSFGNPDERERIARALESDSSSITIEGLGPATNRQFERVLRTKAAQAVRNPRQFLGALIDRGPYLMFLMLPVFALLLKLLYVRHGRLYAEHVIFSLHVHAYAFFAFAVGVLLDQSAVEWVNTVGSWIGASAILYLVLALRHVYEQGFLMTTLKASILLVVYTILLTLGFTGLLLLVILLM
jgi:hypothetical protein